MTTLREAIEHSILNSDYWLGDETTAGQVATIAQEIELLLKVRGDIGRAHLGYATTNELLAELATRLETTQNSISGRDLANMCREAQVRLGMGILNYSTMKGMG